MEIGWIRVQGREAALGIKQGSVLGTSVSAACHNISLFFTQNFFASWAFLPTLHIPSSSSPRSAPLFPFPSPPLPLPPFSSLLSPSLPPYFCHECPKPGPSGSMPVWVPPGSPEPRLPPFKRPKRPPWGSKALWWPKEGGGRAAGWDWGLE